MCGRTRTASRPPIGPGRSSAPICLSAAALLRDSRWDLSWAEGAHDTHMTTTTHLAVQGVTWNLPDLYAAPDDAAIAQDLDTAMVRARAFAQRYRGTINVPGGPAAEWLVAGVAE